ncbi:MAG: amino acid adenylation domain-containing protein [Bacteroidota bacterium]
MDIFKPLHEEIFSRSLTAPDRIAVVHETEQVSFGLLDLFSTNLAWELQQSGIGPGSMVGIYLNPSVNLAISILAVLKSGAAYVPLSLNFPEERIRYILHDANVKLVITDTSLPGFTESGQRKMLCPDWFALKQPSEKKILKANTIQAGDLAYIMYTSGSTGNPKGVMIEHRNLNYYVHWFHDRVISETRLGLPLSSSFIFAAAVTQFYSTLLSGRTLHILDPLLVRQPEKLLEWYSLHPQTGLYCVPTLWAEILNYLETREGSSHKDSVPACIYLSGEAVSDALLKKSFGMFPELQLWNLYGPTEATANITSCRLYPDEKAYIGQPLHGTTVLIVGDDLNPVQTGDVGELLASGEGIARGYLNLPELTEKTFISLKINGSDPAYYYRSGDLVKIDESGRLIYVGRKDDQVKIRGFRIELAEIEQTLLRVPEIKHAVAKVVEDRKSGKTLVAYLEFNNDMSLSVSELRKILLHSLPDFMIPEIFVSLEHFPQLANGKIDRKSLPLPGTIRPELGYPAITPSSNHEKAMVRIWEEVLGLEGIGLNDNFFDLGGNSLKANALVLELYSTYGISIPIRSVFEHLTAGNLAKHPAFIISELLHDQSDLDEIQWEFSDVSEMYSPEEVQSGTIPSGLSENQKALWFMQQAEPELSAYNIFYNIQLSGDLDTRNLDGALKTIIRNHDILRTKFRSKQLKTEVEQPVLEIFHSPMPITDLEAISHSRAIASQAFKLEDAPLFRFILYELGQSRHSLSVIVHHIVFDGFSFDVFLKELSDLYDHKITAGNSGKCTTASYAQFCKNENLYLSGIQYVEDKQFWQKQLFRAPAFFEIATDFSRPDAASHEGGQLRRTIDPILKSKLKTLGDRAGASMFMTCLSAFSVLLNRHSGRNDFLIGTPAANRFKKWQLSMIGYFVNTILLRIRIGELYSFNDLLGSVRDQTLESLAHSRFPFSHLNEVLRSERIQGVNPFFQLMFAYHEADWRFASDSGLSGYATEEFFGQSKFDLFAEIFDRHDDAEVVFTYSSRLYQPGTIQVLLDHFVQILEDICESPKASLKAINMMSTVEYHKIVQEWNQTAFPFEINGNLFDLVEQQIKKTPDLPALVSRNEVISYKEMGHQVNVMAANLFALGVTKGTPVGIHLENSPLMVKCILAVFKAGGIYIPLDPYYPEARFRYVIDKTKIRYLIVDAGYDTALEHFRGQITRGDELLNESSEQPAAGLSAPNMPGDLAYILFTSGSTGNPKGVMIRHESLMNFLVWTRQGLELSAEDAILAATSINFDISIMELFAPLISGARVVLEKRKELQAPEKVEAILNDMNVNIIQFVPSGLKALHDAGVIRRSKQLKAIISGGEKLSKALQEQILSDFDGDLFNQYGPTEATVYAAKWHCLRDNNLRIVPIGTPVSNATLYILDEDLKPVPIGVPGEIYIGGKILADGYFEDPDQTAARFLPDPFVRGKRNRIYKTGDLAMFRHDGAVELLGRTDQQVKIRGFRIELGEIESVILRFPGIRNAVVNTRILKDEDVRLFAYLVPEPEAIVNENELRDFLRLHLPAYMIPGHCIIAPAIPVLPNGKTDFNSLLNLRPQVPKIPDFIHQKMNETERALTKLWHELLEHHSFTSQDNFFEVGGHSLLLVKLKDLIAENLNEDVSIVDLFRYPSIHTLSAFLRKDNPEHTSMDLTDRVALRNQSMKNKIRRTNFPR